MAYNLDYTKTADLLAAYKQERPVTTFLKDRYFADGTNFATDEVLVEYKKGRRVLAPFVSPQINGKVMKRQGYTCKAFEPAMIQPKRVLTLDSLKKKGFGEAYYNQLTPAERAMQMTIDDLNELRDMIDLRKEQMASEVLQKNSLTMNYYTDDNDLKEVKNIAFYENINPAAVSITNKWNTAAADILADIKAMCVSLQHEGLAAREVIVGGDVAAVLTNNEKIQKLLDIRRYEMGNWEPEELYEDVTLLGELNCYGKKVKIIEYLGSYEDEATGNDVDFIDSKSVIVTAPGCGVTNYGAITQIDYGQADFTTYVEKEVPLYEVKDQSRGVILKSAPLLQPKNLSPFRVAKVL